MVQVIEQAPLSSTVLAQTSVIPGVPINGMIISVVITIFVPLFKDTYGYQNRDITDIKSCQITFWKWKCLHVQKFLSNKKSEDKFVSFHWEGLKVFSASKMDLGGPSGGDSCLWPPVVPGLDMVHWSHLLPNRRKTWSRSSLVDKIKHCRSNGNQL